MARMKIEVKSARRMSKGLSLRDRLIGNLPEIAPWARRLPWLFNLAWFVQSYLGFAKQRSLPKWPQRYLPRHHRCRPEGRHGRDLRRYLLQQLRAGPLACRAPGAPGGRPSRRGRLADFGRAGAVLRAHLPGDRPGHESQSEARRLLQALLPFVAKGVPIVRPRAVMPVHLRDEFLAMGWARTRRQSATTPSCSRNSWCARRRPAGSSST